MNREHYLMRGERSDRHCLIKQCRYRCPRPPFKLYTVHWVFLVCNKHFAGSSFNKLLWAGWILKSKCFVRKTSVCLNEIYGTIEKQYFLNMCLCKNFEIMFLFNSFWKWSTIKKLLLEIFVFKFTWTMNEPINPNANKKNFH